MLPPAQRESTLSQSPLIATPAKNESWENGGDSVALVHSGEAVGSSTLITETYSVGGYNYTNLTDAVAQARRMTKVGGSSTDGR